MDLKFGYTLHRTALVYSYLKPGAVFLLSWEHPVFHCLSYNAELGKYVLSQSYVKEGPELHSTWKGVEIVINHHKLSTYLNTLVQSGLLIEQVIESEPNVALAREQDFDPANWYSVPRARVIPTTFIVKARKPE